MTGGALTTATVVVSFAQGPFAGALMAMPVAWFWWRGVSDINQSNHTILRNFPVLGHIRYHLEVSALPAPREP
jgi:hypothetical protein